MTRKEFWRERHKDGAHFWLTGSKLIDMLTGYELENPIGKDVTEIGVGLRYMTKELVGQNNRVTAVDIVEEALIPTRSYADTLLLNDIQSARPADLAFCHLVFQHSSTEDVKTILRVPLKEDGVFAFQTAYLLVPNDHQWNPIAIVWHPKEEILDLATEAGLEVFWSRDVVHQQDGATIGWTYFKARRL